MIPVDDLTFLPASESRFARRIGYGLLVLRLGLVDTVLSARCCERRATLLADIPAAYRGRARTVMLGVDTWLQQAASIRTRRQVTDICLASNSVLRIHCISDLHTDYRQNLEWVQSWESRCHTHSGNRSIDVLLVAGDLSSIIERAQETLAALTTKFDEVFFVPGNHDVWSSGPGAEVLDAGGRRCSVAKLQLMLDMCKELGVRTDPARFYWPEGSLTTQQGGPGPGLRPDVWVFPLLSWYHSSFDTEPDLPSELQHRNGDILRRWGDFRRCHWPESLCPKEEFVSVTSPSTALSDFFAGLNEDLVDGFWGRGGIGAAGAPGRLVGAMPLVFSLSHFVPRLELLPEKRFLTEPMLAKVVGSDALGRQVERLGSDVHVYGHTHIPYDLALDGVRYVQWPLGSPREQGRQCRAVREMGPLLLYDSGGGGLADTLPTLWGDYYRTFPRDLTQTHVPEWALRGRRAGKSAPPAQPPPLEPGGGGAHPTTELQALAPPAATQ